MVKSRTYYSEWDPYAAQWIRNLVEAGHLPPGDVDERSIVDVQPDDLRGYTQCHFFAGIGGWAYAARLAGWPDDREIWTGSCPCQPFSVAGKQAGTDDPRHLWPHFFRLISACRPAVVMGEQVAQKAGYGWFDGVRSDLEGEDYACRAVDIPACSIDAPHIRSRLYWVARCGVADADRERRDEDERALGDEPTELGTFVAADDVFGSLEHTPRIGRRERRSESELRRGWATAAGADVCNDLADTFGSERRSTTETGNHADREEGERVQGADWSRKHHARYIDLGNPDITRRQERGSQRGDVGEECASLERADVRNGTFWSDAEWIRCHDGKARRTQPGTPLLVDRLPGRVALWRGFGNAIVPPLAAEVIRAFMETQP